MGKILVALGFEKLPEVLKIAQSGHTAWQAFFLFASNYLTYSQDVRVEDVVFLVHLIVAAVVRKLLRGGSLWRALLRPPHLGWTVPVGKQIRNEVRVFGADVEAERPESGWDQNCKAYFAVTEVPLNYVYILMLVFNVPFT